MLAIVRLASNGIAQGSVTASIAGQQMLNSRGLSQDTKGQPIAT